MTGRIDKTKDALDQIEAALAEVTRICHGGKWQMCIPANPRTDSDIIISGALVAARAAITVKDECNRKYLEALEMMSRADYRNLNAASLRAIAKAAIMGKEAGE